MSTSIRITIICIVLALGCFAGWFYVKVNNTGVDMAPVDINSASFSELDAVPYVTPAAARGIISHRPFLRVDDLIRVSGIGEKTLEKIRAYVKVE